MNCVSSRIGECLTDRKNAVRRDGFCRRRHQAPIGTTQQRVTHHHIGDTQIPSIGDHNRITDHIACGIDYTGRPVTTDISNCLQNGVGRQLTDRRFGSGSLWRCDFCTDHRSHIVNVAIPTTVVIDVRLLGRVGPCVREGLTDRKNTVRGYRFSRRRYQRAVSSTQ